MPKLLRPTGVAGAAQDCMNVVRRSLKSNAVRHLIAGACAGVVSNTAVAPLDILRLNLVGFFTGPMPAQPFGWFKEQITELSQIDGLKYRTVGLAANVLA